MGRFSLDGELDGQEEERAEFTNFQSTSSSNFASNPDMHHYSCHNSNENESPAVPHPQNPPPETRMLAFNYRLNNAPSVHMDAYQNELHPNQDSNGRNNEIIYNVYNHPHDYSRMHGHEKNKKWNPLKPLCVLFIIMILQRYIPPPPPPNQSWTEFIVRSTESCMYTTQIVCNLVMYISQGCLQNMYADISYHFARTTQDTNIKMSCTLSLPSVNGMHYDGKNSSANKPSAEEEIEEDSDNIIENRLMSRIAGQDFVIRNIAEKLKDWNKQHTNVEINDTKRQPLSMLLTGPKGVAKYETALSLADILLHQCDSSYESTGVESMYNRILTLEGIDYALDASQTNNSESYAPTSSLVTNILEHIHNHQGSGTVIIIKHLENISPRNKQELLHLLHQSKVRFSPKSTRMKHDDNMSFGRKSPFFEVNNGMGSPIEINLKEVAIIATSHIGADKIFKVLLEKAKGIHDESTYRDIEKAIIMECTKYFDNENVSSSHTFQ